MTAFPKVGQSIVWSLRRNHLMSETYTGKGQQIAKTGDVWSLSVTIPPLQGDDFRDMRVAYRQASKLGGFFEVADDSYSAKYTGINPYVDGTGQTGGSIDLYGVKSTIHAGDRLWFVDTGQVVEVRENAAPTSEQATVLVDPPIRFAPSDNSKVVIDRPLVAMRCDDMSYQVQSPITAQITVQTVEWIGQKASPPPLQPFFILTDGDAPILDDNDTPILAQI